jgi:hypothetical protein
VAFAYSVVAKSSFEASCIMAVPSSCSTGPSFVGFASASFEVATTGRIASCFQIVDRRSELDLCQMD